MEILPTPPDEEGTSRRRKGMKEYSSEEQMQHRYDWRVALQSREYIQNTGVAEPNTYSVIDVGVEIAKD